MKNDRGVAPLVVVGALAIAALAAAVFGPAPKGSNLTWWNPNTWGKHAPASAVDKAEKKLEVAEIAKTGARDSQIHAAHVEIYKASVAVESVQPGQAKDATVRFVGNGLSALDQADPLSASEHAQALAIVQGLLSQEVQKRENAETAQKKAEDALSLTSQALSKAQLSLKEAHDTLSVKQSALRNAFDRENALANEMRNHVFLKWLAVSVAVILAILALYLHAGLGRVGQALHPLSKILSPDDYSKVVSTVDGATDWLHQALIAVGRKKEEQIELKAQKILGIAKT